MISNTLIESNDNIKACLYIAVAAMMWGTIGIFGKLMIEAGLAPEATGCIKLLGSSLILFLYFLNGKTSQLKIRWNNLGPLLAMAFVTQTLFNFSYYPVVKLMGVTQAGVLLYTMPIFLTIWSVIIFKETMTVSKMTGIIFCLLGSFLAITGGSLELSSFSYKGIILGLISAITFSLMSVFSKILLKTMKPLTIIFYAFLFGGLMMLPFVDVKGVLPYLNNEVVIICGFGLCMIGSVIPYVLYFKGIELGVDLSKAGIISVLELVTSIILAMILLNEHLTPIKFLGVGLIITAIIIIQKKPKLT